MNAVCHTGQSCQWFALTSCGDQNRFLIRIIFQLVYFDQCIVRNVQITKFGCNGNDIDHASAFYHYLTSKFICGIDDLLHTIHIGCKGCNNDSLMCMITENTLKCFSDLSLCHGKSRAFCIGTVAHQRKYAFFTDLTKTLQINGISVNRCIIYFKVTGVYHGSCRRIDGQCCRILNAVICLDKLHTETSKIDVLSVFYHFTFYFIKHIVLTKFVVDNADGQLCRINRHIDLTQHIRKCSDMILMTVRDKKSLYTIDIVF